MNRLDMICFSTYDFNGIIPELLKYTKYSNINDLCAVYLYRHEYGGEPDYYLIRNFEKFNGVFINLSSTYSLNYKQLELLYYSAYGKLDEFKIDKCTFLDYIKAGVKKIVVCGIYDKY